MAQEYRAKGAPPRTQGQKQKKRQGPPRYQWVFHGPPIQAPGGAQPFMVPEEIANDLARHLEALGFMNKNAMLELADADGMLDVRALPGPSVRHDPPQAGPRSWLNPGQWVPVSSPAPKRAAPDAPDLTDLTDEQAEAARMESEAINEGLRRREVWKARMGEADPREGER